MLPTKIEVKNLSKIFYKNITDTLRGKDGKTPSSSNENDKIVLDNLSFVFNSGDIIGLIGRNGAGKSTLLSILAGLAKETSGEIIISGKVTAVMTLGIGLREDLSGRKNIYLDGELQGKSQNEIEDCIEEIISFSELGEFIDVPVRKYSTGMKSRLAFSMLVGLEPEILIIDEALSAGDVFFAKKATQKIKEICQKGKIVIIVSHSMATIETMCNRCLWIEKGAIVMDDKPEIVTSTYLQKIREEDQNSDIKKYEMFSPQIIDSAKCKVVNVSITLKDSDYHQSIFHTKDSFVVHVELEKAATVTTASIKLTIERIDGIVISHEEYELDLLKPLKSPYFNFEWALDSLVLNKGYYQLKIDLLENNHITNQFSRVFEVRNNQLPKGGVPLLHYPAEITTTEEIQECSDLKELITE